VTLRDADPAPGLRAEVTLPADAGKG
jgi:hypothetical protein